MNSTTSYTATLHILLCAFFLGQASCNKPDRPDDLSASRRNQREKPVIYVVNYPLQYFAERIGGDLIEVHFPAPPDIDPAYWKPDTATIADYQRADLILLNGAAYAKWIQNTTLPQSNLVNTTASVQDEYIEVADTITHSHGPGGTHSHAGTAFTMWLDPSIAQRQVRAIRDSIQELLPEAAAVLDDNWTALEADLLDLDRRFQELVSKNPTLPLIASHPVYQYFARRYKLELKSVHWEPDQSPDVAAWNELEDLVGKHPAKWMIWEAQPLPETVQQLSDKDIQIIVFAPCANAPPDGDYLDVMRDNLSNLRRVFADTQQ